eukprot:g9918.t1
MLVQKSAAVLRAEARMSLEGKWLSMAAFTFVYLSLCLGISYVPLIFPPSYFLTTVVLAVQVFVLIPFQMGYMAMVRQAQNSTPDLTALFLLFNPGSTPDLTALFLLFNPVYYLRIIGTCLLMGLFVILWSLLLIVPGIIAAFRYSQAFWIILQDPSCGCNEALDRSSAMMIGNKWKLFCLELSFIGWAILAVCTFGI